MSNTKLLELAERCEKATGPDRALDIEMLPLVGLRYVDEGHPFGRVCYDSNDHAVPMPQFTASIDAAVQLVGEESGMSFAKSVNRAGGWSVALYDEDVMATGASRALALCAAALKARASQ